MPAERLRAAIEDPVGRARRKAAAEAFGAWWRGPAGAGPLRAALDAAGEKVGAEAALAAARPWLEDIGWIERAFARAAALMRADPLFEPPFRQVSHETQAGIRLLDHPLLALSLAQLPLDRVAGRKQAALGARSIVFPGRRSLSRVLRAAGAVLDLWENDAAQPCLRAASAGTCRRAGRVALADGMILAIDGAREAWTLAGATDDVVLLQAFAHAEIAPLMLEYGAEDGRFVGATMTGGAAARMQLFATLLRRTGRRDAAPAIARALADAPFHLRWQLARELAGMDATIARPVLAELAAADPHDEVRAAATMALGLLAA